MFLVLIGIYWLILESDKDISINITKCRYMKNIYFYVFHFQHENQINLINIGSKIEIYFLCFDIRNIKINNILRNIKIIIYLAQV